MAWDSQDQSDYGAAVAASSGGWGGAPGPAGADPGGIGGGMFGGGVPGGGYAGGDYGGLSAGSGGYGGPSTVGGSPMGAAVGGPAMGSPATSTGAAAAAASAPAGPSISSGPMTGPAGPTYGGGIASAVNAAPASAPPGGMGAPPSSGVGGPGYGSPTGGYSGYSASSAPQGPVGGGFTGNQIGAGGMFGGAPVGSFQGNAIGSSDQFGGGYQGPPTGAGVQPGLSSPFGGAASSAPAGGFLGGLFGGTANAGELPGRSMLANIANPQSPGLSVGSSSYSGPSTVTDYSGYSAANPEITGLRGPLGPQGQPGMSLAENLARNYQSTVAAQNRDLAPTDPGYRDPTYAQSLVDYAAENRTPAGMFPASRVPTGMQNVITSATPGILSAAAQTGLDPRTIVGQALQESSSSNPTGVSGLARAGNLFGMKTPAGYQGPTYNAATGEVTPGGQLVTEQASFRAYPNYSGTGPNYSAGLQGYANQIRSPTQNYAIAGQQPDIARQAQAIAQAGWATDPQYAQNIVSNAARVGMPTRVDLSSATQTPAAVAPSLASPPETQAPSPQYAVDALGASSYPGAGVTARTSLAPSLPASTFMGAAPPTGVGLLDTMGAPPPSGPGLSLTGAPPPTGPGLLTTGAPPPTGIGRTLMGAPPPAGPGLLDTMGAPPPTGTGIPFSGAPPPAGPGLLATTGAPPPSGPGIPFSGAAPPTGPGLPMQAINDPAAAARRGLAAASLPPAQTLPTQDLPYSAGGLLDPTAPQPQTFQSGTDPYSEAARRGLAPGSPAALPDPTIPGGLPPAQTVPSQDLPYSINTGVLDPTLTAPTPAPTPELSDFYRSALESLLGPKPPAPAMFDPAAAARRGLVPGQPPVVDPATINRTTKTDFGIPSAQPQPQPQPQPAPAPQTSPPITSTPQTIERITQPGTPQKPLTQSELEAITRSAPQMTTVAGLLGGPRRQGDQSIPPYIPAAGGGGTSRTTSKTDQRRKKKRKPSLQEIANMAPAGLLA